MVTDQVVADCFELQTQSDKHDEGALTVTHIVYLFASQLTDVTKGSREILGSHIVETKVPKLNGTRTHGLGWVVIAPTISDPDIETPIGQDKSWRKFLIIDDPGIAWVD